MMCSLLQASALLAAFLPLCSTLPEQPQPAPSSHGSRASPAWRAALQDKATCMQNSCWPRSADCICVMSRTAVANKAPGNAGVCESAGRPEPYIKCCQQCWECPAQSRRCATFCLAWEFWSTAVTQTLPHYMFWLSFKWSLLFFLGGWMFFRSSLTCVLEQSPCNSCGLLGTRMCPPSSGQERWASNCAHHTQNCTESAVLMASVIQGSWTQIRAVNSWRRVLSAGRCVTSKKGGWFHQSV